MTKAVPIVICALFAADALLGFLYLGNFAIGQPVEAFNTFLDLDGEKSLATWYSSVKLFAVADVLALLAFTESSFIGAGIFAALAASFLGLSADEMLQVHEFVGERLDTLLPSGERKDTMFCQTGIWMFVVGIPAVGAIALLFRYAASRLRLPRHAVIKCLAGLAVFAAGAMGMETVSNFTDGTGDIISIAAEEVLEMLGVTILLWGVIQLLQGRTALKNGSGFMTVPGQS